MSASAQMASRSTRARADRSQRSPSMPKAASWASGRWTRTSSSVVSARNRRPQSEPDRGSSRPRRAVGWPFAQADDLLCLRERSMPRAMWKGAISFGLVTIPVAVYPATEEKTLRFNQLHDEDMGRIRYKRVCEVDGEEVPFEHIVKGYEIEKDRYVVLTDEDFDAVPVESSRAIDIQQFVELEEIDPILFKKSYYLVPEETGAKAYALLRQALEDESKVGVAKVSFRDKEHLAGLRFKDEVLVLETMYWPDEIRAADFDTVNAKEKVRDNEVEM